MYVVHKSWVDLRKGSVLCPLIKSQNLKIIEQATRELLLQESPPHTKEVSIVRKDGWTKVFKVSRWMSGIKLSAVYAQFGTFCLLCYDYVW